MLGLGRVDLMTIAHCKGMGVISLGVVSGFHRTAFGRELVFREDRMIPHIFRHVSSTLFGKVLTSHANDQPKGPYNTSDSRPI